MKNANFYLTKIEWSALCELIDELRKADLDIAARMSFKRLASYASAGVLNHHGVSQLNALAERFNIRNRFEIPKVRDGDILVGQEDIAEYVSSRIGNMRQTQQQEMQYLGKLIDGIADQIEGLKQQTFEILQRVRDMEELAIEQLEVTDSVDSRLKRIEALLHDGQAALDDQMLEASVAVH